MPTPFSRGMPVFVGGVEPGVITKSLPVFLNGSHASTSGQFAGLPVFVECVSGVGNLKTGSFPVLLVGQSPGSVSASFPVTLMGGATRLSVSLPISVAGPSGVSLGLSVFVSGEGVTPNAYPFSASFPVTVWRNPAAALNVYVHGPGNPVGSGVPVSLWGNATVSGLFTVVLPDVVGTVSRGMAVYTNGF